MLFSDERYKKLDSDAKLLYGLMLNRMCLSQKNGWFDVQGRVYIYYTLEEAKEVLGRSRDKVVSVMKELSDIGLIERRRQGLGKPSVIYVKNFATLPEGEINDTSPGANGAEVCGIDLKKSAGQTTGSTHNRFLVIGKTDSNNIDKNNTEESKTYLSISRRDMPDKSRIEDLNDPLILQKEYMELLKDNVDYAALVQEYPDDVERIDEMLRVMVNVICFGKGEYSINRCKVPAPVVASQFCKLNREHIVYVLSSLKKANKKLTSPEAYMVAALYTSRNTALTETMQQLNHDIYGAVEKEKVSDEPDFDLELLVDNNRSGGRWPDG